MKFNQNQQEIINECVAMKLDPTGFAKPHIDIFKMRLAFQALRNGCDLTEYLEKFNHEQLDEIRLGLCSGVDVRVYAKPELSDENMHMQRIILEDEKFRKIQNG